MVKRTLATSLLLSIIFTATCQENVKNRYGINTGAFVNMISLTPLLPNYALTFTIEHGLHTFGAGLIFSRSKWDSHVPLIPNGLQMNYQFDLLRNSNHFDLFIETNFNGYYDHNAGTKVFVDFMPYVEHYEEYVLYRTGYQAHAGFGSRINFIDKLYLNLYAGFGYYFESDRWDYNFLPDVTTSYNSLSVLLKAGVGYRFGKK